MSAGGWLHQGMRALGLVVTAALVAVPGVVVPGVAVAASASGGSLAIGALETGVASVVVVPRFRAGDTITLQVEKSKHVEVAGQTTSRQGSRGDIVLRVLANDADGSRIECVYGAITQHDDTDPEIRANPLMQVMLASREGMTVRFATGPRFSNPRVENVDEVLAAYRATLAKATQAMSPEIAAAVMRLVEPMLANKQAFAAKLVEDLYVYFLVIGADVPLQGAKAIASAVESPAGGAPVKTWSNLRVERHDRAANRVQLGYRQESNPQDVKALADRLEATARKEAQKQLAGNGEAPAAAAGDAAQPPVPATTPTPPATPAAPDISVQDVAVYDVDLASGWPDDVQRTRTLKLGNQVLVDRMTFKRVP